MSITARKEFEFDLYNDTWSGAKDRMHSLTDDLRDKLDSFLQSEVYEIFGEEVPEETQINDFLWFEDDTYAEWLGFEDANQMWKYCDIVNNGADEDEMYWDGDDFVSSDALIERYNIAISEEAIDPDDYSSWEEWASDEGYEKFEL